MAIAYFRSDNFKAAAVVVGSLFAVWTAAVLVSLRKWQWKMLLKSLAAFVVAGSIIVIFLAVLKWAWTTLFTR